MLREPLDKELVEKLAADVLGTCQYAGKASSLMLAPDPGQMYAGPQTNYCISGVLNDPLVIRSRVLEQLLPVWDYLVERMPAQQGHGQVSPIEQFKQAMVAFRKDEGLDFFVAKAAVASAGDAGDRERQLQVREPETLGLEFGVTVRNS